jgi:hypothetical protein
MPLSFFLELHSLSFLTELRLRGLFVYFIIIDVRFYLDNNLGNELYGELPFEWQSLSRLEIMEMNGNMIEGSLPGTSHKTFCISCLIT